MMSNNHKNKSTMNFVLVNPQHVKVSNPVIMETIMLEQEEHVHDPFFKEQSCNTLLATMQKNKDISKLYIRHMAKNCFK